MSADVYLAGPSGVTVTPSAIDSEVSPTVYAEDPRSSRGWGTHKVILVFNFGILGCDV